jgi:transcription elongation factor GreB
MDAEKIEDDQRPLILRDTAWLTTECRPKRIRLSVPADRYTQSHFPRVVMSKAFTRETESDDDDAPGLPPLPAGGKNYITPAGYARLRAELLELIDNERPRVVDIVHWAASNGDRSENGDYLYGKKRLREIDRRIRFLTRRLEIAEVTDPSVHHGRDQVFFGATVTYADAQGEERTVTIMGIDEADSLSGQVSWISPIARALLKAREGDVVRLVTPQGMQEVEVMAVRYPSAAK